MLQWYSAVKSAAPQISHALKPNVANLRQIHIALLLVEDGSGGDLLPARLFQVQACFRPLLFVAL